MEAFWDGLRSGGVLSKASALALAGMAGVFFTLFLFFLLITALERFSRK